MPVIHRNIPYDPAIGINGVGDVFLPDRATGAPVLFIHGGGWNKLAKENVETFAICCAGLGRPVFSINYRLISTAPWPACADDCVAAGRCILEGGLMVHGIPPAKRLVTVGTSAGGHLSMIAGLRLPADRVELIVNISGIFDTTFASGSSAAHFFQDDWRSIFLGRPGVTIDDMRIASPEALLRTGAPPLLCIHSENDQLVPPDQSRLAIAAWQAVGSSAEGCFFAGVGESHGIREITPPINGQPAATVRNALAAAFGSNASS